MARLNEDAQWIVLMGFLVSISLIFLAIILNQSTIVGQTTAESVIEFPKNDIRDFRSVIIQSLTEQSLTESDAEKIYIDIKTISLNRKNAIVYKDSLSPPPPEGYIGSKIHYNNGVTKYYEEWTSDWKSP